MLEQLKAGNQKFVNVYFKENIATFERLAKGQSPQALFITCSDSRFSPNLITDCQPGELFVVRNVGNFVPPFQPDQKLECVATAIEFAVEVLQVKHIFVCGHSQCGACESLYKDFGSSELGYIPEWLTFGMEAKKRVLQQLKLNLAKGELPDRPVLEQTEKTSVLLQKSRLLTYPFVKKQVEQGALQLHALYYRIETGLLEEVPDSS